MTVSVQTPISSYTGNGVTTAFSFGYYVGASGDLVVMVDGVVQTLTTHYSLTGIGSGSGGTCTFVTAPASGASVVLYRDTDLLRDTDYQDNGDLLAAILDADFDRIWLALQESLSGAKTSSRNVRSPIGETLNELPEASARAGKVLSFNAATGQPEAVAPTSGTATDLAIQLASTASGDGAEMIGYLPFGTGADATTVHAKLRETVSVTDFGADPLGVTDSSPAFQAAHDALPTDGGEIFVPRGRYLMNAGITTTKPVTYRGTGSSTVNNEVGGSTLYKAATVTTPLFTLSGGSAALKNMTLQGVTGNTGNGVTILAGRCTIEDLSVFNMGGDGVRIGSDAGVNANLWTIRNLKSKSNTGNGLHVSDKVSPTGADANGGTLLHADLQSNGAAGCLLTNSQLNTYVGLVCQNNTGRGLSLLAGADSNSFIGGDFESSGADEVGIEAGATSNRFIGGNVAGTMTDNGNNTLIFGMSGTQFVTGIKLGNFDSVDTRVLDWYEEGSWTPVLTFATPGDLAVTYSAQVGRFTRIGGMVTATFTIVTSAFTHTTASGQLRVTGLPYASISTANLFATGALQYTGITGAANPSIVARIDPATSHVGFLASGPGVSNVNVSSVVVPTGGTVTLLSTITYRVT
jgi:Pectate lyase superfamily protein